MIRREVGIIAVAAMVACATLPAAARQKSLKEQQFPKTRNSKHSSGILTCLFVNRHAKMELSGYE